MKTTPENAIQLANAILMEMDSKELDPLLCYSALGCAFLQLHQALGKSKDDWLELLKEMAENTKWENSNET